jgi:hypothetical protein
MMALDPDKPYNDLPLLPPKAELETKAVLRKVIAANKTLAALKAAGDLISKQTLWRDSPSGSKLWAYPCYYTYPRTEKGNRCKQSACRVENRGCFIPGRVIGGHMFVKRTYHQNMSKKAGFFDIVGNMAKRWTYYPGLCFGAILKSRQKTASMWRDSQYRAT